MGLATLVDDAENGVLPDAECVGLEVPVRVRSSGSCLRKQGIERRKCSESDVLTEVRPKCGVESGRIAFIQGHDLSKTRSIFVAVMSRGDIFCFRPLGKRGRRRKHQTAGE